MSETEKSLDAEARGDKFTETVTINSVDGDEALELVGTARTTQFSEEFNLKLRRKLDLLIIPLCGAIYFTQFLDKASLNYASIMDFPIVGQQYNLVSGSFYFGFLLFEFPTVYISQKLRVAKYLGANICVWGCLLMLQCVTPSFGTFFALRFLMGMCEACVAPILILIISMFYKKNEQASRIAWFFVMNGISQVFGGFVAYGISFSSGTRIPPYKILYLMLGGMAVVVGILHARFLTKEERIAALERVRDDQGGTENHRIKKDQIFEAFKDIRTWLIVLSTLMTSIPNGALSNFGNIIIEGFGYTAKQTLILSTPLGAIGSITTLVAERADDTAYFCFGPYNRRRRGSCWTRRRPPQGGLALWLNTHSRRLSHRDSTIYAYNASNTSGNTKKSTVNAMTLVSFAVGNIIGTEIFQPSDAPSYIPGKIAILTLLTAQLVVTLLLRWVNLRLNVKKRVKLAELKVQNGWSDADVQREREKYAFADLTDKQ
ncbi:MFS general substrate transporter [Mycena sanguinolenta]|uniref:MFS general substrate transporter n=1 Tax=Mycena sanguinolenta TaxID=230812 RepID=A0A8H6Y6N6_9AGAR|nr:MFS general substrate transporter [Mycena sanguinolenta]